MSKDETVPPADVPAATTTVLFERAVRDHSRRLLAISRAIVGNRASPEDIVQQALTNLYRHRDRYDWREPGGLMRRSVVNESLRVLRQPRMITVTDEHPGESPSPMSGMIDRETILRVRQAIDRLPENFRAALVLCEYEKMSYAQIAETLGASIPQVKTWLHRGRRQLAHMLEEFGPARDMLPVRGRTGFGKEKLRSNAISEIDLELLEDYLDDALSPAQVEHVTHRLATEPELAMAMHELRAGRALRTAAWRSLEPPEADAAAVSTRVSASIRSELHTRHLWQSVRVGGAVAATVAVFVTGWMAAGPSHEPAPKQNATRVVARQADVHGPYHVAMMDDRGKLVPVEEFSGIDEAREFADDLARFETRRQDAHDGTAMLVSEQF